MTAAQSTAARQTLPVGVVLPTLNAGPYLAQWLPTLQPLLALAREVVVVDSFSSDGTLDFLKSKLRHPAVRFLTHAPGLYQCWNFGLRQLTSPYAYIATVGDGVTPAGLRRLFEVAEQFGSDVVISRPEFISTEGQAVLDKTWPIHDLVLWQAISQAVPVDPAHVFLLSLLEAPEGLLGSSASNLYRTATLQRLPFPSDYGHLGDTAWTVRHAFELSFAVTPEIFSRFLLHPRTAAATNPATPAAIAERFFQLGATTLRQTQVTGPAQALVQSLREKLPPVARQICQWLHWQARYEQLRRELRPWVLHPSVWQARARRNQHRRLAAEAKRQLRQEFGLLTPPAPRKPAPAHGAAAPQPATSPALRS